MCSLFYVHKSASYSQAMLIFSMTKKKSNECSQFQSSKFLKLNHLNSTCPPLMNLKMSLVNVRKDSYLYVPLLFLHHFHNGVKFNSYFVVLHKLFWEKLNTMVLNKGVWARKIYPPLNPIKIFFCKRETAQPWTRVTFDLLQSQRVKNINKNWTQKWLKFPKSGLFQIKKK